VTEIGLQQAASFIQDHDAFTILVHVRPDGDAVGAALSCAHILQYYGKPFRLIHEAPIPGKYQFLPLCDRFEVIEQNMPIADTVIALDCGDDRQLGKGIESISDKTHVLNIDHHRTNPGFGTHNFVDATAAATCQLMYRLAKQLQIPFNKDLATCIYTGLLFDTGGFRYSNTTEEVHKIAAEMIQYGVEPYDISDRILETVTWSQVQLIKCCLDTLKRDATGKLAWIAATHDMMERTQARDEECEGLVNYARNLEGVEVGVFFREVVGGKIKVSLRSKYYIDVSRIAAAFQGGGHARAAGCTIEGTLNDVMTRVLQLVQRQLSAKD
jgi:phosphoesterase RecJ-like protein